MKLVTEKLEELLQYYLTRRQVGHTYTMLHGALNNPLATILTGTWNEVRFFKHLAPNAKVIVWDELEYLRGLDRPIALDNHAVTEILRDALTKISMLEKENQELRNKLSTARVDYYR